MATDEGPPPGEMRARIDAFDWSHSPLGARDNWSAALRTSVEIALASRFPMILWWGPELVVLYNDAYVPILASKHPAALGVPGMSSAAWGDPEVRRVIEPMLRGVLERGEATWSEDQLLILERNGFTEETYFTWSYSPVRQDGSIEGVFSAVTETTGTVIGGRRLAVLSDLTAATLDAPDVDRACARASGVLDGARNDVAFHTFYLWDGDRPRKVAGTGPPALDAWFAAGSADARITAFHGGVLDLRALGLEAPSGLWPEPVRRVVVEPLIAAGDQQRWGFLVCGASPRLLWDQAYSSFIRLIASRVASAIADARALDDERRRVQALAELDRSKSVFFSNVSHEFRTPLTLMLGPLEDALHDERDVLGRAQRDRVETARANGLRMLKLVNSLLDFSRVEAGGARADLVPTDLSALTENLVAVFRSAFASAGLGLEVRIEPLDEPIVLDPDMWETVVLNLVSNALKYTHEGRVVVELRQQDRMAELSVSDTGVGIEPEELDHIFDRFYRSKTTGGRSLEGTGIGLALVRELVQLHGGSIDVQSAAGVGSTFTVRLPMGDDAHGQAVAGVRPHSIRATSFLDEAMRWLPERADDEPERADDKTADGSGGRSHSGPTPSRPYVLVADDNADMRRYLRSVLEERYEVVAVADGNEALARAQGRRPDAIVSDIMMPGLDGLELTRAVRRDAELRDTPVLLVSARAGSEATIDGLAHGADDYLVKPFTARDLIGRVGVLLDAAVRRSEAASEERAASRRAQSLAELGESLTAASTLWELADVLRIGMNAFVGCVSVTVSVLESGAPVTRQYQSGIPPDLSAKHFRFPRDVDSPQNRVIEQQVSVLLPDLASYDREFPGLAPDFRASGSRACSAHPMFDSSGALLGAVAFGWRTETSFDADLIQLLEEVTTVASRAVERVQLVQQERSIAETLQRRLLAVDVRSRSIVTSSAYEAYEKAPVEVGGDWFDIIDVGPDRVAVTIGDVVGHGLAAAAVMGQLRSALAAACLPAAHAGDALAQLDAFGRRVEGAQGATAAVFLIDLADETMSYCCAGHPPPVLVEPDGTVRWLDQARSWPLALDGVEGRRRGATVDFREGSLLLAYTDGLVERRHESLTTGLDWLEATVGQAWTLPVHELTEVVLESRRGNHDDDVALVGVRHVASNEHLFADVIAADPAAQAPTRAALRNWLDSHALSRGQRDAILLAVGEAVANAIDHGSQHDRERVVQIEASIVDGSVIATVSDSGQWQTGMASVLGGRGRGLTIMHAMVDHVDTQTDASGTTVTLRHRVTQDSSV